MNAFIIILYNPTSFVRLIMSGFNTFHINNVTLFHLEWKLMKINIPQVENISCHCIVHWLF
jgi:hypothetical protein